MEHIISIIHYTKKRTRKQLQTLQNGKNGDIHRKLTAKTASGIAKNGKMWYDAQ
jgi:hypothetical protein